MTALYYFSGSGHSRAVAEFLAGELCLNAIEITKSTPSPGIEIKIAVIVFPVYCQNIPTPILPFLKELKTPNVALIATYGKISHGNVLFEAARLIKSTVIASAYIGTGHTYLGERADFDTDLLRKVAEIIKRGQPETVKRSYKNPFADFFPSWRSRIGVKITRLESCTSCGKCNNRCPAGAIKNGIPDNKCIRCLRCVSECPSHALKFTLTPIMKRYLTEKEK